MDERGRRVRGLLLGAGLLGLAVLGLWRLGPPAARDLDAPHQVAFVDDRSCAECHRGQYRRWRSSHHAKAMQVADEATVLGDFSDVTFSDRGLTARFFRRGRSFVVTTEGPSGEPADFEIAYTFGVAPLQQYLIAFPGGRLQGLTIAWDTSGKRWFSLYPDRRFALDDPRHWTGRYQNWNLMCAECHSTNLRKGYDAEHDSYETRWDALSVGCQACHGPGRDHVAWARAPRAPGPASPREMGLPVALPAESSRDEVDVCARCHSRRVRLSAEEHPGRVFLDDFRPQLLRADLYHADGQQLGEVYEYGSFRQSLMYQRGVRCTDCHDPHAATLRAQGNALCTRCHRAERYDSHAHHSHAPGSTAAACVACHMPARTYMGVDARRDHRMPIPRPDLSVKLAVPNACNGCHTRRSARWAADVIRRWYGPKRPGGADYAETIAAARTGARRAVPGLVALASDAEQPAIVRATALDLLRGYGAGVTAMLRSTTDEDPIVRVAAAAGLGHLAPRERILAAVPLLEDPVRAVRIEAARVLAPLASQGLTPAQRRRLEAALTELKTSQAAMTDMPEAHVEQGLFHETLGQHDRAELAYAAAVRMDPYSVSARGSLARLYDRNGQPARAESVLREGLRRTPGSGDLHYALGLLLAEGRRFTEAAEELGHAVRQMPDRARVRYNYGLVLQEAGRPRAAEVALARAHELDAADPDVVYALAILYAERGAYERAAVWAARLVDLRPNDPRTRQLAERLLGTRAQDRTRR